MAVFGYANFTGDPNFCKSVFNTSAIFFGSRFRTGADFSEAIFTEAPNFYNVTFGDSADFSGTQFKKSSVTGPNTPEKLITTKKSCEIFSEYYKNQGNDSDADIVYYNYRKHSQEKKSYLSLSTWIDIFSWLTCGYGLRLSNTLLSGAVVIYVFTWFYGGFHYYPLDKSINIFYWKNPNIYKLSDVTEKVCFWDTLYFSIIKFTNVSSTDWSQKDNFKKLVIFEGLLGLFIIGLFMANLINILIRS